MKEIIPNADTGDKNLRACSKSLMKEIIISMGGEKCITIRAI
jgi:hypothetical protein